MLIADRRLAALVIMLAASSLISCSDRTPDAVDRWAAWEGARAVVFFVSEARRDEAEGAVPLLSALFQKPVAVRTALAPEDQLLPQLVWNEFNAPLARACIDWEDSSNVSAAVQGFGAAADRDGSVFFAWAGTNPHGMARRFSLVASRLSDVPWDLLRIERHTGTGMQCFRRGLPFGQSVLKREDGRLKIDGLRLIDFAAPLPKPHAWRIGAFRIESSFALSEAEKQRLRRHLQGVANPFASARAPQHEIVLVLHRDPDSMRRRCGRLARQRIHVGTRTVHWLIGAEPCALPELFGVQHLLLQVSTPFATAPWWTEGLATLLAPVESQASWLHALPLMADSPTRPKARDLLNVARFHTLLPWQRRSASAWLLLNALAGGVDLKELAALNESAPTWPWIADQVLDYGIATMMPTLPKSRHLQSRTFSRVVAIEPAFTDGYFDPQFGAALDRARAIGADSVLLVHRGRPATQDACSRVAPLEAESDELAWAVAEAQRRGLRVRLRLRYQETRLGAYLGGIWRERGNFWVEGLQRYDAWSSTAAFASRAWNLEAIHLGFEFHGVFEPSAKRPERLIVPLQRAVLLTGTAAGVPVVFDFKSRERLNSASFLRDGDRVAVGTRDFFAGYEERARRDVEGARGLLPRGWMSLPTQATKRVTQIAAEEKLSRLELSIGIHAHSRAVRLPQWPLPDAIPSLRRALVDLALAAAFSNPFVSGIILEGGEYATAVSPLDLGFADPESLEHLRQRLATPAMREVLSWVLPLAG